MQYAVLFKMYFPKPKVPRRKQLQVGQKPIMMQWKFQERSSNSQIFNFSLNRQIVQFTEQGLMLKMPDKVATGKP